MKKKTFSRLKTIALGLLFLEAMMLLVLLLAQNGASAEISGDLGPSHKGTKPAAGTTEKSGGGAGGHHSADNFGQTVCAHTADGCITWQNGDAPGAQGHDDAGAGPGVSGDGSAGPKGGAGGGDGDSHTVGLFSFGPGGGSSSSSSGHSQDGSSGGKGSDGGNDFGTGSSGPDSGGSLTPGLDKFITDNAGAPSEDSTGDDQDNGKDDRKHHEQNGNKDGDPSGNPAPPAPAPNFVALNEAPTEVPEPLTISLFAGGLAGTLILRRRKRAAR